MVAVLLYLVQGNETRERHCQLRPLPSYHLIGSSILEKLSGFGMMQNLFKLLQRLLCCHGVKDESNVVASSGDNTSVSH